MFGDPCPAPVDCNVMNLLWTCIIKGDGTKKARYACNGSPSQKGAVTLGKTYASALDHSGY